jgi:hypothetical protein
VLIVLIVLIVPIFPVAEGSVEFNRFLDLLGDRIDLQGWKNFRGGLDIRSMKQRFVVEKRNNNSFPFIFR